MQTTITSKGQVTIPRDVRQHFGLRQGMSVSFTVEGDHIAIRPAPAARQAAASGFGLIQSQRPGIPADFDVAGLAVDAP
jgi:AbrB family looped-hinge helix DNA binding protein